MVCRPNSRSLSVTQGKGLDLAAAKASGLMEAVESYHAETIALPIETGSARTMRERGRRLIDVDGLPRSRHRRYSDDVKIPWIQGVDLISDTDVWMPYEIVHTDYTLPYPDGSLYFAATTNGLASGNHPLEAIAHGICEVIERDAISLWHCYSDVEQRPRSIDLDTVDDPGCRSVLELFECADINVTVWDITSNVGVATFHAMIIGKDDRTACPDTGSGCHPVREVALLRALTEAAQIRLTYIAGSRDDVRPELYLPETTAKRLRECRYKARWHTPVRHFHRVPNQMAATFEDDIEWLLNRLLAVGIDQVAVVDLTQKRFGIPVLRIVIPGLEGPNKNKWSDYLPGMRAASLKRRFP
jgi:ribosomal protein S12 methylthiotransferase accessory factor